MLIHSKYECNLQCTLTGKENEEILGKSIYLFIRHIMHRQ